MTSLNRHIPALGRFVLALFIVANSGFTLIVNRCTMPDRPAGVGCCGGERECGSQAGASANPSHSASPALARTGMPCLITVIAGGLQSAPAIAEKDTGNKQTNNGQLHPVAGRIPVMNNSFPVSFPVSGPSRGIHTPPSVEKYVLNASLLI